MQGSQFSLKGKTILITGATSGIGKECARIFAELGANVVLSGRSEEKLKAVANELCLGNRPLICADLSDENSLSLLARETPPLDGFAACAGIHYSSLLKFSDENEIEKIINLNCTAQIKLTRHLLRNKKFNKGASLVFMSSTSAFLPQPAISAYSASKAALIAFTKALSAEIAPRKCRANAICPALVKTPMTESFLNQNPELAKIDEAKYPLGYGKPEYVANAAAFLLSDASIWITGTSLTVDGGLTGSK